MTIKLVCTEQLVGFGISIPEQAQARGRLAEGVSMGSANLDAVGCVDVAEVPGAAAKIARELHLAL